MRLLAASAVVLAVISGCAKPMDRLVTGGGEVLLGRLETLGGGTAEFRGFSCPVPSSDARVVLRSGGSFTGTVTVSDGRLVCTGAGGEVSARLKDVSCVVWGATGAESALFDVPACAGWVNSHIIVERGAQVILLAGGAATFATGSSGPEGLERTGTSLSRIPEARDGSLVARIGEEGVPFTVGEEWSGTADASGELWLAVNLPETSTPAGSYTVSVTVGETPGRDAVVLFPARR